MAQDMDKVNEQMTDLLTDLWEWVKDHDIPLGNEAKNEGNGRLAKALSDLGFKAKHSFHDLKNTGIDYVRPKLMRDWPESQSALIGEFFSAMDKATGNQTVQGGNDVGKQDSLFMPAWDLSRMGAFWDMWLSKEGNRFAFVDELNNKKAVFENFQFIVGREDSEDNHKLVQHCLKNEINGKIWMEREIQNHFGTNCFLLGSKEEIKTVFFQGMEIRGKCDLAFGDNEEKNDFFSNVRIIWELKKYLKHGKSSKKELSQAQAKKLLLELGIDGNENEKNNNEKNNNNEKKENDIIMNDKAQVKSIGSSSSKSSSRVSSVATVKSVANDINCSAQIVMSLRIAQGMVTHKKPMIGVLSTMDDSQRALVVYDNVSTKTTTLVTCSQAHAVDCCNMLLAGKGEQILRGIGVPAWQTTFAQSRATLHLTQRIELDRRQSSHFDMMEIFKLCRKDYLQCHDYERQSPL